ncbi:hypothetical protein, partial [Paraglaciecola chathamensis]
LFKYNFIQSYFMISTFAAPKFLIFNVINVTRAFGLTGLASINSLNYYGEIFGDHIDAGLPI